MMKFMEGKNEELVKFMEKKNNELVKFMEERVLKQEEEARMQAEHKRNIEEFDRRATLITNLQQGGMKHAETVVADNFGAPLRTGQLKLQEN